MTNDKYVLGIDLGTSSIKAIVEKSGSVIEKYRETYDSKDCEGWWKGLLKIASKVDWSTISAIGLSSQVGTYIINDTDVIEWSDTKAKEELKEVIESYPKKKFVDEISMPHPEIVSYPIPRLKYIKKNYEDIHKVCQPKDFLCEMLTGQYVTDKYSWRGLTNGTTGEYSRFFLEELGIDEKVLPKIKDNNAAIGYTKEIVFDSEMIAEFSNDSKNNQSDKKIEEKSFKIPEGIPVFAGLNDFYASILGLGVCKAGDAFDISGTSEHIGVIGNELAIDTKMVSSPYFDNFVHYGVTGSSGVSQDFGLDVFGYDNIILEECIQEKTPIFLPYLNGERAPIWDGNVRGMFYGINAGCTKEQMAYAVLEGVAFSLYHIYEYMDKPKISNIKISGGSSVNMTLNYLKAELFGVPVYTMKENDTSAFGACIVAEVGIKNYDSYNEATAEICGIEQEIKPDGKFRDMLIKRYEVYKTLYPKIK